MSNIDDELMDDDLFADLYGDDDKNASSKSQASGAAVAPTTGGKASTAKPGADGASRSKPAESQAAPIQAQAPPTSVAQNQFQKPDTKESVYSIDEDSYQGWDIAKNDQGSIGNKHNGYTEYGGYDGHDTNYNSYSGGGDTGHSTGDGVGSTAIKEDGKMFIGGLNWETTDESLKNYFSQFGEVTECTVMRDGSTGRSRGFGFLTFKDPKTVNIVMVKEHFLDGKIIDPKRAIPRDEQDKTSKIFVGGVSQDATEADFREFFTQFGRVLDSTLMIDKETGRPRGFGFVTFDNEAAVENALSHPNLEILGKPIEVKKAMPRGNPKHDDQEGRQFNRGGQRFNQDTSNAYGQQNVNGLGANPPGQGVYNGMTPQVMAQYWQRMQQYMAAFMQQMGRGRGVPATGGMPAMNPAMMAAAMGMGGGMNPMMQHMQMQQLQQMQQMQSQQQQPSQMAGIGGPMGGQGGPQSPPQQPQVPYGHSSHSGAHGTGYGAGPAQGGMGAYGAQQQRTDGVGYDTNGMYEQGPQQQQQSQQQHHPGHQSLHGSTHHPRQRDYHQRDFSQQPTSWEGMYDDVPSQQHVPNNQSQRNINTPGTQQAPSGPPPNAPTGPKNLRGPTGQFRGAGRGMDRSRGQAGFSRGAAAGGQSHGFHPYARNPERY